jgi:hypothetical protein
MVVDTSYEELVISPADARLIAATPDLLDAARMALVALEDEEKCEGLMESGIQALDSLRAAIAKAEGTP